MSVLDLQNLETEAGAAEADQSFFSLWGCEGPF
ncbi:SapB/AmfS family lanthipeptide [Streptomyces carpaticus]|nr:SapB/AmfS family lanthipeptide [Streptomyces sp. XM4011]MCK1816781.1 SapB/AmfS family lanthipeptide [Streptomyces sp. XM4011]UWM51089.1 SapB/AmfS family lanthipeptide [Streptomyces carpaticus]